MGFAGLFCGEGKHMGRTTAALERERSRGTSEGSESTILAGVVSILGLTADEAEAMYAHARVRGSILAAAAGSSAPLNGFAETAAIAHIVARLAAERRLGAPWPRCRTQRRRPLSWPDQSETSLTGPKLVSSIS